MLSQFDILEIKNRRKPEHKVISYSQLEGFLSCPHKWKLHYIDKLRFDDPSIHLIFGTAFHETIQQYVETYFNSTIDAANRLSTDTILMDNIYKEYTKMLQSNNNVHFSSVDELTEFANDGIAILNWVKRHSGDYLNKTKQYLVGTEIPIYFKLRENLYFNGYIDQGIGFLNLPNNMLLWDYKTSTRGWGAYQKADKIKLLQLVLYKYFILKELNLDIKKYEKNIDVEYFIVKRKLIDNSEFLQKRVQILKPAAGIVTINKAVKYLNYFTDFAFKKDSCEHNKEQNFPAISGVNGNNCKFCPLKDNDTLCPKHLRKSGMIIS